MEVELTTDLYKIKGMYHKIKDGFGKDDDITVSNLVSICFLYWFTHPKEYAKDFNEWIVNSGI